MSVTIGPHVLTRGMLSPYPYKSSSPQEVEIDGAGGVVVTEGNFIERFWEIRCRLPRAEAQRLILYIENSLRYSAETVTVVDGLGVSRLMRYWGTRRGQLEAQMEKGVMVTLNLMFREEVSG